MKKKHYLGMRPGDLEGKPYAKYWNPAMKPLQPHVRDAAIHGAEASAFGFPLEDADQLMAPGYLPLENGTTKLKNGETFVAVLTQMPGVTGAMFEWWMGWHYMEAQRYKLWHPRSHVDNGTREMLGDDTTLSDKEKYRTTHYVSEYIGSRLENITITFFEPETIFTQTKDFGANNVSALVCGQVALQGVPIVLGHLVHQIRQVDGGAEMRSRFWLGKPEVRGAKRGSVRNRLVGSKWFSKRMMPPDLGQEMLVHCGMEMNHLAGFLPDLYADYH